MLVGDRRICVLRRHRPRFMLMLIMFVLSLPAAMIVEDSPNFARMTVILPQLALFFGMGFYSLIRARRYLSMWYFAVWLSLAYLLLLSINCRLDLDRSLYRLARQRSRCAPGQWWAWGSIAHYLDKVGDERDAGRILQRLMGQQRTRAGLGYESATRPC